MTDTRFKPGQSGNPRGRPTRKSVREMVGETGLAAVIKKLQELAAGGDALAGKVLLEKAVATPRPESVRVTIQGFDDAKTPTEKADLIVRAAASGEISPSVAQELTAALASTLKVMEVQQLAEQLAALEKLVKERLA